MKRVVIIGGGITGLSAALHLQDKARERGLAVDHVLLERDRRLGGKILTEKIDGYVLDAGPDCFVVEKPGVFELAERVGVSDRLLCTNESHKGTFVLSGGRLHQLPEGLMLMVPTRILPFLASPLISWPGKLRMALDLVLPPRRDTGDESLESFVVRRLGREALDKIAEPLVSGIHGAADPAEMSVLASFPRFIKMEQEHGSLIRAMLAARKGNPIRPERPDGYGSKAPLPGAAGAPGASVERPRRTFFMSFTGGMGDLVEAALAHLDRGRIRSGVTATRLERTTTGYAIHVAGGEPISADAVIVAAPSKATARLVADLAPDIAARLAEIRLASTAVVSVAYRRADIPHPLRGFGFIVPGAERRKIMGVTYSSLKWNGRAPDDTTVLLRVFVGGARNLDLIRSGEAGILAAVRQELRSILGITAEPVLARVHPWLEAMHQYTLGHLDRVAAIEQGLSRYPGLFLAGGAYRGVGVGDCIRSGFNAAEQALAHVAAAATAGAG